MGRRKIEIQPITHERNRSVTFLKRKNGLFKKAYELGVLCSVDVAVIVFEERPGHHLKLYQYASSDINEIVQRHLHHDGEIDTRGPVDFSGNTPGAKDDGGEGDEDEVDDEPDEVILPSIRGPKRRADGQPKQINTDITSSDIGYGSARPSLSVSHQHSTRLIPSSMTGSHHHQHPVSSDRLESGSTDFQNKRPRLGIPPSGDVVRSRSADDDLISSAVSPGSSGRSARYPDLSRDFVGYGVSHPHNNFPTSPPDRQRHPQYTPIFPSAAVGAHYSQGGSTPPPPNFIPLQSHADFAASPARARSASGGSGGIMHARNVFGAGAYGGDGSGPASGGGSSGGGGTSGDLFAAFMDAEQQARLSMARRSSISGPDVSGRGGGSGGSPFGLDWPIHMSSSRTTGHGEDSGRSKSGSHSSAERDSGRDMETSSGSGGSGSGSGSGNGNGNSSGPGDWLDFLSGAASGAAG